MTSRRLEQQYLRLLNQVGVQPVEITLQELADKRGRRRGHNRFSPQMADARSITLAFLFTSSAAIP